MAKTKLLKDQLNTVNESIEQINALKGQLARALADYDNLRKRTESERVVLMSTASFRLLIKLLPVLDMIEDAQKHLQDQGLAIALGEFKKIFQEENLQEIVAKQNDEFNEELHEALEVLEGGKARKIANMVLSGWRYKDGPVLRHAKVTVYKGEN